MIIEKPLESITEEDLKRLVENQVIEKKHLEYKRILPSNKDSDKKEFLADIVSFANTSGGDLIYGITQDNETGYPSELLGIDLPNLSHFSSLILGIRRCPSLPKRHIS